LWGEGESVRGVIKGDKKERERFIIRCFAFSVMCMRMKRRVKKKYERFEELHKKTVAEGWVRDLYTRAAHTYTNKSQSVRLRPIFRKKENNYYYFI
jgi:hypothetical protein